MYRKTKGGLWRKVDAGGNWFRSDSIRPETLISKVWEQIKRSERKGTNQKQSAIIEMEKIIAKHPEIVSDIKDPSLRNRLEKKSKAGLKRIARTARAIKEKKKEADKLIDQIPIDTETPAPFGIQPGKFLRPRRADGKHLPSWSAEATETETKTLSTRSVIPFRKQVHKI